MRASQGEGGWHNAIIVIGVISSPSLPSLVFATVRDLSPTVSADILDGVIQLIPRLLVASPSSCSGSPSQQQLLLLLALIWWASSSRYNRRCLCHFLVTVAEVLLFSLVCGESSCLSRRRSTFVRQRAPSRSSTSSSVPPPLINWCRRSSSSGRNQQLTTYSGRYPTSTPNGNKSRREQQNEWTYRQQVTGVVLLWSS